MDVEPIAALVPADGDPREGCPETALAETCRVVGGRVPLWPYHRERLLEGGCGEPLLADIERSLAAAIAAYNGEPSSRLRAHLEVGPDAAISVEVERRLSSLDVVRGPLVAAVSLHDLDAPPRLPRRAAKPADRSWWDAAARAARRRGAHQALICDAEGYVLDGSSASVWAVVRGGLVTPPSPPAVAGVARRFVLVRARERGVAVAVRPLLVQELEAADEVFLTNAFGGAVAVRDRGGPVSHEVATWFAEVWPRAAERGV